MSLFHNMFHNICVIVLLLGLLWNAMETAFAKERHLLDIFSEEEERYRIIRLSISITSAVIYATLFLAGVAAISVIDFSLMSVFLLFLAQSGVGIVLWVVASKLVFPCMFGAEYSVPFNENERIILPSTYYLEELRKRSL